MQEMQKRCEERDVTLVRGWERTMESGLICDGKEHRLDGDLHLDRNW
jgi:hypothetical protein